MIFRKIARIKKSVILSEGSREICFPPQRLRRAAVEGPTLINQLVYFEFFHDIETDIAREKQLKGWTRAKKIALIEKMNPGWEDLLPPPW
jgi:hypothetical protein